MRIYIVHSKSIDYINEIYKPIRNSEYLKQFDIVFPHEKDSNSYNDRTYYKNLGTISFAVPSKLSPGEHKLQVGQIGKDYQISSNFYFSVLEGVSEFASTTQEYIADDCIDLTYNLRRRHEDKIIPGDVFKLQSLY